MAIERGHIESMKQLGSYYHLNKQYQQMEVYYLMAINRGNLMSLINLFDCYQRLGKIDEILYYYLRFIDKFNVQCLTNLSHYYQNNTSELLNQIYLYKEIDKKKDKYSRLIIKGLPLDVLHFRFRDQSIGAKIIQYHFQLSNGSVLRALSQKVLYIKK